MVEFVRRGEHKESVSYLLMFDFVGHTGWGYAFDCDENGVVLWDKMPGDDHTEAKINYEQCKTGSVSFGGKDGKTITQEVQKPYVKRFENSWWEPAIIKCHCGREVELSDPMTNECDCGQFYNGGGQELSNPSNWGEETGERFDAHGHYIGGGED